MGKTSKAGARDVAGILLLDKPSGVTSNRVLQRTKRLFQARKAGHTGTLDPLATGMLPICLGAATRVSGLMLSASKAYRVTAAFGSATDTGDAAGAVISAVATSPIPPDSIEAALEDFKGRIRQIPPMYSAVKHEGRRLYALAREGKEVQRQEREVEVFEINLDACEWPNVTFTVHCSKGTYIRTLVSDLASSLGSLAHVRALRRLAVGPYGESQMLTLEELEHRAGLGLASIDQCLLPIDTALKDRPAIAVSTEDASALRHGRAVMVDQGADESSVRIYDPRGTFVGLGRLAASGQLRPAQIFPC